DVVEGRRGAVGGGGWGGGGGEGGGPNGPARAPGGGGRGPAKTEKGEHRFVDAVSADQPVHGLIEEGREKSRWQVGSPRRREDVRHHHAAVPVQVAVSTFAILPGAPPEDASEDDRRGGAPDVGVVSRLGEDAP